MQPVRHPRVELEPDDVAAPAPLQQRLERAHEILGFLLQLDVAVAQHAERALALDLEAREQLADEQRDHLLELDEAHRSVGLPSPTRSRMKRSSWPGIGISPLMRLAVGLAVHPDGERSGPC